MSPPLILAKAGNEIMVNNKVEITLKIGELILLLKNSYYPLFKKAKLVIFFKNTKICIKNVQIK